MTLIAPRKKPVHQKKNSGKHHRHSKTYHKPYLPYLPVLAIVIAGVILSNSSWLTGHSGVLSYATEMSTQSLLDNTNSQRINNGLGALAINGLLNNAAQAKANDMSARDYWSHETPDGKQPWSFMDAAGYKYQLAGENLAYGYSSSATTVIAWMNSPGHRANILNGGYTEVGFGYINIANYQSSGPETLVVAMYGAPASPPVAAATPAPAAANNTVAAVKSAPASSGPAAASGSSDNSSPTSPATDSSTPSAAESGIPEATPDTSDTVVDTSTRLNTVREPDEQHITRSQILTAGRAPWAGMAVALIGAGSIALFLLRHAIAWHKVIKHGEQLIIQHPILDLLIISFAMLAFALSQSVGVIR